MRNLLGTGTDARGTVALDPATGSYVMTVWFILLGLPILPFRSFRVDRLGTRVGGLPPVAFTISDRYKIFHQVRLRANLGQILRSFLFGNVVIVLWLAIGINIAIDAVFAKIGSHPVSAPTWIKVVAIILFILIIFTTPFIKVVIAARQFKRATKGV